MANHNNRVLSRIGARALTPEEEAVVTGGIRGTTTICSAPNVTHPNGDGDPGECG
jgi:hypothetical protein